MSRFSSSDSAMRSLLVLSMVLIMSLPARAAEPVIILDDLVGEALRNNPRIAERQAMQAVAEKRVPQAGVWPEPMFTLGVRNMGLPLSVGKDPMSSLNIGVAQMFPFPGKTGLRTEVARREAERTGAEVGQVRLEVVARLKAAYFDLYEVYRSIEVVVEIRDLLKQVARIATAKYGVGQVSQTDVLKARVEIARMTDELLMLEARKEALKGTINGLLNRPPLAHLGRPVALTLWIPPVTDEQLVRWVNERSPALQMADAEIQRTRAAIDLARKEYLPDFTLMGGFMNRGSMAGGWELSLSVNLPIFFTAKQDQMVLENLAMHRQARSSKEAMVQDMLAMLRAMLAMARAAARQEELYRTALLPQARQTVRSAMANYAVGKIDFLMLFDTLMIVRTYERQYAGILSTGNKALAQIETLVGGALDQSERE